MKVAIIGYGKMGKTIAPILEERGHQVVMKITHDNIEQFTDENIQKCDVAIEFTSPESAVANYLKCFKNNVPVVSGTTAWHHEKEKVDKSLEENNGTLFYAPNFSIGVNIFFKVSEFLAQLMQPQESYDVKMEEIHHTEKKDSPSGTAIKTLDILLENIERKSTWIENVKNNENELLIETKREENVPGTHKITFFSDEDELSLEHKAYSRKGFALGAVLAAEWVYNKKGYFEMSDMLQF